jgi:hypothetical protein
MFERHDKKLIVFAFQGRFYELVPIVFWSMEIYKEYDSLYILERNAKKTCRFHELLPIVFRELLPIVFCELLPIFFAF